MLSPFPGETRCGECRSPVRLYRQSWSLVRNSEGEAAGYQQHAECRTCGSFVYAILTNDEYLARIREFVGIGLPSRRTARVRPKSSK